MRDVVVVDIERGEETCAVSEGEPLLGEITKVVLFVALFPIIFKESVLP
jgi:hypothetical protein